MVLGGFQCQGVLLLWNTVGQGPAVFAAGVGRVGCFCSLFVVVVFFVVVFFVVVFFFCFFFVLSSILSSFSNASSVGRRLDILKYCGRYNPAVLVSYYRRRAG